MTSEIHSEFLVLGAGVSGLAIAHDLAVAGKEVTVIDKDSVVGGCAQTVSIGGFLFEKGPFNLLVRDPLFEGLVDQVSDRVEVVSYSDAAKRREIVRNGRREPLPQSLMGAIKTPLLSPWGKVRLMLEPLLGRRPHDPDPTLGDLFRRRFGSQFVDRILSAAVVGIFAGDCNELSAKSCFRFFWEIDKDNWSFLVGGIKRRLTSRMNKRKWKGMVSFRGGLGSFCEALAHPVGDRLHLGTTVDRIEQQDGAYRVETHSASGESQVFVTPHLILGMDLKGALPFLQELAPTVAQKLEPIESASLAVVNLGFSSEAFEEPPVGFGFLVPEGERDIRVLGTLFASSVFPHQAPEGCHSLRVFVGGYRQPDLLSLSDEELSHHAVSELSKLMEIKQAPLLVQVSRYPESIPQMVSGHSARIEEVEEDLKQHPGLHLVGNYLHGVSVNDCICHARRTAAELIGSDH
ncbi:MAG: protoporphyrinogen oxidase [Candidatus Omnitrophica bacterium]|nr:protoporphyrinogen oxidase [Candidatus Omnitrophota bacterium]